MSAETQIYAILSATGTVTSLVSDRIYHIRVPDGKPMPSVAFRRTATEYAQTIHGPHLGARVSIDIACVASGDGSLTASTLADAVEAITGVTILNRASDEDPETGTVASIVTVDIWEVTA